MVQQYVREEKPGSWLFPGQNRAGHLTERMVQKVFEHALLESGVTKKVSIHALRPFATHLIENGIDLRYIQELLDQKSA